MQVVRKTTCCSQEVRNLPYLLQGIGIQGSDTWNEEGKLVRIAPVSKGTLENIKVSDNYLRCTAPGGPSKHEVHEYGIREVKINGYN